MKSTKLKLKDKIKNFFKIDIEKDLQEEECTKKFEKVNLFTLTKNKLFFGILAFLLLINILVGFDINQFYIRAILSFIFLIIIPGLLIMLMLKIREVGFWEYLVYTVGLSVSFIMFGGLAVNWILPLLNITNKPLSLYPILICFNIFLLGFWIVAWIRNKKFKPLKIQSPKLDLTNRIFFIVPMLFPVLSILGAFLLNNHGTNILTMVMLGGIAVYVLLLTIFRKKLNSNIYPWALYWIGLALLLMGCLRSWGIASTDASLEFNIARSVLNNGYWNFWELKGNYSAMLSVTILPTTLVLLTKINALYALKIFYPFIFSFTFIVMWVLFIKFFKRIFSFLSILFFIFQPTITSWTRLPFRQEIAFLFLALFLLIFLHKNLIGLDKKVLLIIFTFSIIISHYSTTILLLLFLFVIYLLNFIFQKLLKHKNILEGRLSIMILLILFSFTFLWYSQLTDTGDSFIDFGQKSFAKFGETFNKELYSEGNSLSDHFNIFSKTYVNPYEDLNQYNLNQIQKNEKDSQFNKETVRDYPNQIKSGTSLEIRSNSFLSVSHKLRGLLIFLSKIFILGGCFLYFFLFGKRHLKKEPLFFITSLVMFGVLIFIVILPFASMNYNLDRAYQQFLFLLCIFPTYLFFKITQKMKNEKGLIIYCFFVIIFLLSSCWVFHSIIGGSNLTLRLANAGNEYDLDYCAISELSSTNWLFLNKKTNSIIVADNYARFKIYQSKEFVSTGIKKDVLPVTIKKEDYVYSGKSNTVQGITFKYFGRGLLTYNFPIRFLNDNKNKIYANGGSEIFK